MTRDLFGPRRAHLLKDAQRPVSGSFLETPQERDSAKTTSALEQLTDSSRTLRRVRKGPIATNAPQQTAFLFDHLVGSRERINSRLRSLRRIIAPPPGHYR